MAKGEIDPSSLTLRFKYGKVTILLFTDSLSSFSIIIKDLLSVLREQFPNGLPKPPPTNPSSASTRRENIPIPESPLDIILGVPIDVYEPSKGWSELDIRGGKAVSENPRTLGVKDGSMIAFAFTENGDDGDGEEPEFWVEFSDVDELYPEQAE